MEKTRLGAADQRAYDLHMQGFPIARIAQMTGRAEGAVHAVIVGEWYEDKLAAKAAKQAARAR